MKKDGKLVYNDINLQVGKCANNLGSVFQSGDIGVLGIRSSRFGVG